MDRRGFVRAGFLGCAGLTLADNSGRPHPVLPDGVPIDELFT
jgi:hypothetical protein